MYSNKIDREILNFLYKELKRGLRQTYIDDHDGKTLFETVITIIYHFDVDQIDRFLQTYHLEDVCTCYYHPGENDYVAFVILKKSSVKKRIRKCIIAIDEGSQIPNKLEVK